MTLPELEKITPTRLDALFNEYLIKMPGPAPLLQQAMAYGVMNGGKRIRPLLVYAVGHTFDAALADCDAPATAIELIHAYSLIHDDLPAMDNADLRRGKPACHKQFSEAVGILAGDTLQTLAFEILATHPAALSAQQRLTMISILATASGWMGMGGGQTLDIEGMDSLTDIETMYSLKTGALFTASLQLGAIAANVHDAYILECLKKFSQALGLAFQIQDDLLDLQNEHVTGKPQGLDTANNKMTYARLCGLEKTTTKISTLFQEALNAIAPLGDQVKLLTDIAYFLMQRQR